MLKGFKILIHLKAKMLIHLTAFRPEVLHDEPKFAVYVHLLYICNMELLRRPQFSTLFVGAIS